MVFLRFNISQTMKIVEFNNFKYNLNLPTNEYRIGAALSILTLLLVYFAVCIIGHRIIPRWIQFRNTPSQFDIIECTDCTITIEWFLHNKDDRLQYILNHRDVETTNWIVSKISTNDGLTEENGRRMYTLPNLEPDKFYSLKLCSIDNEVKSQYTESKTMQTHKLAPRQFDIIECTDSTITIEWFIHNKDDCLEYILNHRDVETNNWIVSKISTNDGLTEENGRRMYKLPNLEPDKIYSLKLCSVDNDVKSQYTESKTMQTHKLVLSEALNQLSEEDKIRYNKLMQTSNTEKRHFVRIMLVGKESAGKTCLLRRLLKEDISDVISTDGVDIVVRSCKINVKDGKWIIGKEIIDDKVSRIKRAFVTNEDQSRQTKMENNAPTINSIKVNHSSPVYETTDGYAKDSDTQHTQENKTKDRKKSHHNNISICEIDSTTTAIVHLNENEEKNKSSSSVMPPKIITDQKSNIDEIKTMEESSSLVMPEDLMSHVFSKSHVDTSSNLYALCELWDFAGQKEFYATHQAFLTSSAVYLVVADMDDDIKKQGLSQFCADYQHIGEYVDFWFDSIHCHRTTDETASNGHFHPPTLLVFTKKDKYDEADFKKREKELNDQIDQVFGYQSKYHHLHDKFYMSNLTDTNDEFEKLQKAIFVAAEAIDHWGKDFPIKWILLEHLIDINKHAGKKFINFTDMSKLAKHSNINILDENDLLMFLRFQHNIGNIIFFDKIKELIILEPQWLADAFRCLVSDRFDTNRLHHLTDWSLFKRQGKISESLIIELFKSKDGTKFFGQDKKLIEVMEKIDILVKIENSDYYIVPSKMPTSTFVTVSEQFGIIVGKCKMTSWLCFKFEFLPPSFFNHLSAWFIRKYYPSKIDDNFALYRGICLFDIDKSGCKKILVTMSTDTIALQVISFYEKQEEFGSTCSDIYSEVNNLIEDIKVRYKVKISFKLNFKCSDGYFNKDTFEYEQLTTEEECFCNQHKIAHRSEHIYSPWMNTGVKSIKDKAKISTKQEDQMPKNIQNKDESFAHNQPSVKTNLCVSVHLHQQINIKRSKTENVFISSCSKIGNVLGFTDCDNGRLIICNADGTNVHHIKLPCQPRYITEVDSNTAAVSSPVGTVLIINISTGSVISKFFTGGFCYGLSYSKPSLYVVIQPGTTKEMDLNGKVIRTIFLPSDGIFDITIDIDHDRLVCIDDTAIYCCSLNGKLIRKFNNHKYQDLRCVTTDGAGNVYVINNQTNNVVQASYDGKHYRHILTESDGLVEPCGIFFDKKENILLVGNCSDGEAFLFDMKNIINEHE